jgi:hypothetical protein
MIFQIRKMTPLCTTQLRDYEYTRESCLPGLFERRIRTVIWFEKKNILLVPNKAESQNSLVYSLQRNLDSLE